MKKTLLLIFTSLSFLFACSEPQEVLASKQQGYNSLHKLNRAFDINGNSAITVWPFTGEYLKQRNSLYKKIGRLSLTQAERQELDYLIIAERFPERFFAWPANRSVLTQQVVDNNTDKAIIAWLSTVQSQLEKAKESNLKLNMLELSMLKKHVANTAQLNGISTELNKQLTVIHDYLNEYQTRGSLGLNGLTNGSEWHQSKLNYFANKTQPPLEWLTLIQAKLKGLPPSQLTYSFEQSHQQSVAQQLLASDKSLAGFDWQQGYINLRAQALNTTLNEHEQQFWLTLMETDIGIHYHRWSRSQAMLNLKKRLNVDHTVAEYLLEDIMLYPGLSFIYARYTSKNM